MPRLIPAAERMTMARALIQKARELPPPAEGGKYDFSYVAQVKDLLRQARDLVKFIPQTAGANAETRAEATRIIRETESADQEILH